MPKEEYSTPIIMTLDEVETLYRTPMPTKVLEERHRISLRDTILREIFLNLLIHREVSNSHPASFTIFKDTMVAENWNIPYHKATVSLSDLTPHPKNPTIARFFANMGYVEELGVGRRTLLKYGPAYFDGRDVAIEEDDVFRITIPYKPTILPIGGITEGKKLALDVVRTYPGNRVPYLSKASGIFFIFLLTRESCYLSVLSKSRQLFVSVLSDFCTFFLSVLSKSAIFATGTIEPRGYVHRKTDRRITFGVEEQCSTETASSQGRPPGGKVLGGGAPWGDF